MNWRNTPTRCGTAICPKRGRTSSTGIASTALTTRSRGIEFNPNNSLLLDPYARAIQGNLRWNDVLFGYRIGSPREDLAFDRRDSARYMPKCRVVESAFTWNEDRHPHIPWQESVILELHVRGFTKTHSGVPEAHRGTFAAFSSPAIIDYLVDLGVTAVEFLPIHATLNDRGLVQKGLGNYWGYNTIGFFAPDPRYLPGDAIREVKTAVQRLHDAGIEVLLDVVYNHTGEGSRLGLDAELPRHRQFVLLPADGGPAALPQTIPAPAIR